MDVPGHGPEVGLVLHQFGAIATLEDMAAEPVSSRPGVGVAGEERLHAAGQIRLRRLEDHMEVVGEDHEGVDLPATTHRGAAQLLLEPVAVGVIADDVLAAVAAGHHVIDRARVLDAESSWHAAIGPSSRSGGKGKTGNSV